MPELRGDFLGQVVAVVEAARRTGAVVVSDECYAELGWGDGPHDPKTVPSLLDPRVCGDDHTNLLVTYSLSKQSNLAGYRAAFAVGDPQLIATLVNTRKHAGMIVPAPVQHAMAVALADEGHVAQQKDRYRRRRDALRAARQAWTDSDFTLDRDALLCIARGNESQPDA